MWASSWPPPLPPPPKKKNNKPNFFFMVSLIHCTYQLIYIRPSSNWSSVHKAKYVERRSAARHPLTESLQSSVCYLQGFLISRSCALPQRIQLLRAFVDNWFHYTDKCLLIFPPEIAIKDGFLFQKLLRVTNLAVFHDQNIYHCHLKSHEISAYKLTCFF